MKAHPRASARQPRRGVSAWATAGVVVALLLRALPLTHGHTDPNTLNVVVSTGAELAEAIEAFVQDGQHSWTITLQPAPSNSSNIISLRGVELPAQKPMSTARDLTIQASPDAASPVILDCDMRQRLVPELSSGLLTVSGLVLINLCEQESTLTDAEGLLQWFSALNVPPFSTLNDAQQVMQNRVLANSTMYLTHADLAVSAYLIVAQASSFTKIRQLASVLLEQISNTNAVVTYSDPWSWVTQYVSAPTLSMQNVTSRSLDTPASRDPLLASLAQQGMILPPMCCNGTRMPPMTPFPEADVHHGPMWQVEDLPQLMFALARAANVTAHRNASVLRDALVPAVLMSASIQLNSSVLPTSQPLNITYPMLLTGPVAYVTSNPVTPVQLNMSGLSSVIMVEPGGELYIQELVLAGLASQLLDPADDSSRSVFPFQAFPPAQGWNTWLQQHSSATPPNTSIVFMHNVSSSLPINDYLALVAMAYSDKDMLSADALLPHLGQDDDAVHGCLGPEQHVHVHRHIPHTRDVHPERVGGQCQWLHLSRYVGWGINGTEVTLSPEQPLDGDLLAMCLCIQRTKRTAPEDEEPSTRHARMVAAVVAATVGTLSFAMVALAAACLVQRRRQLKRGIVAKPDEGCCGCCTALCVPRLHARPTGARTPPHQPSLQGSPKAHSTNSSSKNVGTHQAVPEHVGSRETAPSSNSPSGPLVLGQHAANEPGCELTPSASQLQGSSEHVSLECVSLADYQQGRRQKRGLSAGAPRSLHHVVTTAEQLMGSCMDVITNEQLRAACAAAEGPMAGAAGNGAASGHGSKSQEPSPSGHAGYRDTSSPFAWSQHDSSFGPHDVSAAPGSLPAQHSTMRAGRDGAVQGTQATAPSAAAAAAGGASSSLQDMFKACVAQRAEALGSDLSNQVVVLGLLGQGSRPLFKGLWRGLPVALKTLLFRSLAPDAGLEPALRAVSHPNSSASSGSSDRPHAVAPGGHQARAIMEAAIAASVGHRNVVCTYHFDVQPIKTQQEAGPGGLQITYQIGQDTSSLVAVEGHYKLYMVQELCATSLQNLLDMGTMRNPATGAVEEMPLLWVLLDVACGLEYLHGRNIIHGDLKPANVLFKPDFECSAGVVAKLTDFGLSHCLEPGATHVSNFQGGTPFFIAPEVIHAYRMSPAADVYSYGVMMWHAFTGKPLYQESSTGGYLLPHPDFPHYLPPHLPRRLYCELTARCLQQDPKQRPTASELVADVTQLMAEAAQEPAAAATDQGMDGGGHACSAAP